MFRELDGADHSLLELGSLGTATMLLQLLADEDIPIDVSMCLVLSDGAFTSRLFNKMKG